MHTHNETTTPVCVRYALLSLLGFFCLVLSDYVEGDAVGPCLLSVIWDDGCGSEGGRKGE